MTTKRRHDNDVIDHIRISDVYNDAIAGSRLLLPQNKIVLRN